MFSPFEELEYLSDHLPEEGEAVLVTRQAGELVCKPWNQNSLREGIHDPQLYGFLVHANERLSAVGMLPVWLAAAGLLWIVLLLHGFFGIGWERWYLTPGLFVPLLLGCLQWMRRRQAKYFEQAILPALQAELRRRQVPFYSLVAGIRQHPEFRTLLDELIHWSPQTEEPQ